MQRQKNILQKKLDAFIDKYYQNLLYKGLILGTSITLIALFIVSGLEFIGRFNGSTRKIMFTTYLILVAGILIWYVVRPLLALFKWQRKLDYPTAARLIGAHFPEVKDKLLNALQLQNQEQQSSLLLASIQQRTDKLSPIPFTRAINFKTNRKYLKYGLVPALLLIGILLISPGFKQSTERVVRFNERFEPPAPFTFQVLNKDLLAVQDQPYEIKLSLMGSEIPEDAYLHVQDLQFKMQQQDSHTFSFLIPNVHQSTALHFTAGGYQSDAYPLHVALQPSLISYTALLEFPAYLNMKSEMISELGDVTVPQGTKIRWEFNTRNVEYITVLPDASQLEIKRGKANYTRRFMQSEAVQLHTSNREIATGDSLTYHVKVIPDAFPSIQMSEIQDSTSHKILYFTGDIQDDHGFTKLEFHYRFENGDRSGETDQLAIPLDKALDRQSFYHLWNLNDLNIQADDEISYYFTVWDNDGIQGAKRSSTETRFYKAPSLQEVKEQTERSNEQIKQDLGSSQEDAAQLEEQIEDVERMLTENKQLDWKDKRKIEDLLKKQEALHQKVEQAIQENLKKNFKEEEFHELSERLQDKQEKLEELFNEVMDEEMKELMEKIRQLMEENQMDELQKAMEEFKLSEKEMNQELDRMLELFKELEMEKLLEETIHQLNELAKEQQELSKETETGKNNDELSKKQEELNQKMEELAKDLNKIDEKNAALESPKAIESPQEKSEETQSQMKQANEQIQKGKNKKASDKQKKAAEQIKEMAKELQEQMDEAYAEQHEEDYNTLRQILENLIQLSFDQERVQQGFKENISYSPKYIELRQEQRRIKDESKLVEDSLHALSKRAVEVQHFVNTEIAAINLNLDKTLAQLGERQTHQAMVHQQLVMTGYNKLALMLSQSLQNMQNQMKADQENKGKPKAQCKKPGSSGKKKGKKPNMNAIKKMQQELAKQLQEMQKGMKNGKKPGSQQFAEMAARQEAIRKQLRDLQRKLQKEGQGGSLGDLNKTQDMMDELEKELYYKRLDPSVMQRLKQIEIKLSEHEKAEQEREQDNKRSSTEGKDELPKIPPALEKYLEQKNKEQEQLREVSPELRPYYEEKVKEYIGG